MLIALLWLLKDEISHVHFYGQFGNTMQNVMLKFHEMFHYVISFCLLFKLWRFYTHCCLFFNPTKDYDLCFSLHHLSITRVLLPLALWEYGKVFNLHYLGVRWSKQKHTSDLRFHVHRVGLCMSPLIVFELLSHPRLLLTQAQTLFPGSTCKYGHHRRRRKLYLVHTGSRGKT